MTIPVQYAIPGRPAEAAIPDSVALFYFMADGALTGNIVSRLGFLFDEYVYSGSATASVAERIAAFAAIPDAVLAGGTLFEPTDGNGGEAILKAAFSASLDMQGETAAAKLRDLFSVRLATDAAPASTAAWAPAPGPPQFSLRRPTFMVVRLLGDFWCFSDNHDPVTAKGNYGDLYADVARLTAAGAATDGPVADCHMVMLTARAMSGTEAAAEHLGLNFNVVFANGGQPLPATFDPDDRNTGGGTGGHG